MIARLRSFHRWFFVVLAIALTWLFYLAVRT